MTRLLKLSSLLLLIVLILWGVLALVLREENEAANDGVFRIVLDPGHGEHDPGATAGKTMEKDINLAVALLVREQLKDIEGVEVAMTRSDDTFVALTDRAEYANGKKADLFVSIHANALENNDTFEGVFTFYHPKKRSSEAPAETIQAAVCAASGATNRGVRSENYVVLRETDMPAVLVEMGFMTCPEELALLQDPEYQELLAQGISQGILACNS